MPVINAYKRGRPVDAASTSSMVVTVAGSAASAARMVARTAGAIALSGADDLTTSETEFHGSWSSDKYTWGNDGRSRALCLISPTTPTIVISGLNSTRMRWPTGFSAPKYWCAAASLRIATGGGCGRSKPGGYGCCGNQRI